MSSRRALHAAPSAGLLARLQALPGGLPGDDDDGKGLFTGGRFGEGVFGVRTDGFGYVPAGAHAATLPSDSGFRIHEVGRQEAERSPWRGRRFAFAAASAVSFAAMALGGTMPLGTAADTLPRGVGNNVTPMRAPGTTVPVSVGSESNRRQGGGGGNGKQSQSADRPVAAAPPGMFQAQTLSERAFSTGVLPGGSSSGPLIQPPARPSRSTRLPGSAPRPPPAPPSSPPRHCLPCRFPPGADRCSPRSLRGHS